MKVLNIRNNYFIGAMPTSTWTVCSFGTNCLTSLGGCTSGYTTQRSSCSVCGTASGTGTCAVGQSCEPDDDARIAAGTMNAGVADLALICKSYSTLLDATQGFVPSQHFLPQYSPNETTCTPPLHHPFPLPPAHLPYPFPIYPSLSPSLPPPSSSPRPLAGNAMMALKTALGVTLTTWDTTNVCRITGVVTPTQNEWANVFCTATGSVQSISATRQSLKGYVHSDISKLTALTYLDLSYNLFQGSLELFSAPLQSVPTLKALGLFSNYLTGTMPIPTTSLVALDVGFNFLSGSFPKLSLAVCAADQNCFLSSSYCHTYGAQQRPYTACAMCGTTNGQGVLCSGNLCAPNSSSAVSQGIVNIPSLVPIPMTCPGYFPLVLMDAASGVPSLLVLPPFLLRRPRSLQCIAHPCLTLSSNYLTGSFPPLPATMQRLNFGKKFISGISTHSLISCFAQLNCLPDPSKCNNGGTTQKSAAVCAICCTTIAIPPLCWGAGGECVPVAAATIAASTVSSLKSAILPMTCSVLLALKASLGVTFTTWAASVPCQVTGKDPVALSTWTNVLCDDTGAVLYIDFGYNLFQGALDSFSSSLQNVPSLKAL
ncbi:unnamed protein product [Closterium sp. Naga37s-1]|nr:unnamed protein product [Closterium sp. Naga37s-1]